MKIWLHVVFYSVNETPEQHVYISYMSGVRNAVEWSYKYLKKMWVRRDFLVF